MCQLGKAMLRLVSIPVLTVIFGLLVHAEPVSYGTQIQPILSAKCVVCHSDANPAGGIALDGSAKVAAVKSRLIAAVSGPSPRMPKSGAPLSLEQVALLARWIEEGAKDDGKAPAAEVWWSRKPLIRNAVPGKGHPLDAFLLAKLGSMKLGFSAEADRRTLIRRVTFDLTGLPPTLEEISAFLSDKSPEAYEKVVDRLLASPRYGERWARHWLDIAHYGDSHGYDKDKPRPNAWPYRDYVIAALNNDKPYARFVEEQLAGDVLYPDSAQATIATGFIAAGPWDFVGHQELREDTLDKNITRNLDRDDMVATTMSAFSSQTVHCARCHNHKFDPITQQDYYGLQAIFAGVDRADRPYDVDPAVAAKRRDLLNRRRLNQIQLQPLQDLVANASTPEIDKLDAVMKDMRGRMSDLRASKVPTDEAAAKQLQVEYDLLVVRRKALVDAIVGPKALAELARLAPVAKELDDELARLPKPELVYAAASYFPRNGTFRPPLEPRPIFVLNRGDVNSPMEPASPGAIGSKFQLADLGDEGARRAALAHWITDRDNPLTWRSIVNRVWHYHFGAGIVDSPSDFGRMGSLPTHPEMLDWLAVWFRDDARGSIKQLHRLIVTSRAYRQSSKDNPDGTMLDSENRYLWRMNRTRLDAESVHDTLLSVSGKLDLKMGGPADRQFWFKDDHSPVYDYAKFDPGSPEGLRRSIYRFVVRSVPDPFMERLDCPDPAMLAPKRGTTITAIQALALLNNPFVIRMAEQFSERIRPAGDLQSQIRFAYRLALARDATDAEVRRLTEYASRNGMANTCRLLFNSNEFVFID